MQKKVFSENNEFISKAKNLIKREPLRNITNYGFNK